MPIDSSLAEISELRSTPSRFVELVLGVEPFDYQQTFLDTGARHFVIASGRQVGKSRMCAWRALHKAMTQPDAEVLITAPSLRQSSMLFDTLTTEISKSSISEDTWGITRQTQTIIEFDNDSAIHCLPTGRNGDKIRGFSADLVIVDEAAFIDNAIFEDILEPMLLATSGGMVLASTPWGTAGYFYRKFDDAQYEDSEWGRIQVHSRASPLIDDDDIEQMKQGKTEGQIDREIRGKFVEDDAQFFPTQPIAEAFGTNTSQYNGQIALGADIAATGDDRTIFYGVDETGNVFLDDQVYENMGVLEAGDRIQALDNSYGFDAIIVDRTGLGQGTVERIAETPRLERKLQDVYFSVQTKQSLYQGLKTALVDRWLQLPDNMTLKNELEDIGYEETQSGNLSFEPREGSHDDHVDALALAVSGVRSSSRLGSRNAVVVDGSPQTNVSDTTSGPSRRPSGPSEVSQLRSRRTRR